MNEKPRHGRVAARYVVVAAVSAAAVALVLFLSGRGKASYSAPRPAVVADYPRERTILSSVTLSGHVEARSMIPVVPLVSGTITDYPAKTGAAVRKGELLARIDEEPFRQQMLQARAAYTGYESSFARVEGLYSSGAATRQEYDTVKAQRDAAKAQYDLAVLQLGYAEVASPIDGTILAAPLAQGGVAGPQQPVAAVADLSDLVVRLDVPEKYFTLFTSEKDNLSAVVTRPGHEGVSEGEECPAAVDTVAPYIDGASKTFETVLRLDGAADSFRPGMYVKARIVFRRHQDVPALPLSARKTDGSCYMFVPDEAQNPDEDDGAVSGRVRHVALDGGVSDGEWFAVPREYAGRLFVVEGHGTVFDNQPVRALVSAPGKKDEER